MLVLRWNQRAYYWFLSRPKGHIRVPKGHSALWKRPSENPALVLFDLSEASSPKSSTSSPSLETVVNLVPERLLDYNWARCVQLIESRGNCACAICTGYKNNRIMPA